VGLFTIDLVTQEEFVDIICPENAGNADARSLIVSEKSRKH
jgi:hypothetical protein